MTDLLNVETRSGPSIWAGRNLITPFAQVIRLRLPFLHLNFTWNRPVSVLVHTAEGQEQVLPVPDVTRQVQWSLLAASLVSVLLLGFILERK